ncbi:MAG: MarR family winged helix-turn-helix transcriptional regulator [Alicyclobacillus sp.]|nr:MarR family winged helix-turn-helix transcriptional regulator [Alicyclobacillus sp.]
MSARRCQCDQDGWRRADEEGSAITSPELRFEVMTSYRTLFLAWRAAIRKCATENQLTETQLFTLKFLDVHSEASLRELSQGIDCTESKASAIIDQLTEMKLVHRVRSVQDRRRLVLTLTDVGRQRLQQVMGAGSKLEGIVNRALDLPEADLRTLIRLNHLIVSQLRQEGDV